MQVPKKTKLDRVVVAEADAGWSMWVDVGRCGITLTASPRRLVVAEERAGRCGEARWFMVHRYADPSRQVQDLYFWT